MRLRRIFTTLVIITAAALGILYLFLDRLAENPRVIELKGEDTVRVSVDTSERWTYGDLPGEWPSEPDPELVALGKELFNTRGCRVCHTIGEGDLVGPDLKDVHRIRDYRWALLLLLRPDSMQQYDSLARALLKKYGVRMPDQRLSLREAEALLHYVVWESTKGNRATK